MIFLALANAVSTRHSLYYSDIRQGSYMTFDCLYAQVTEQIIVYDLPSFVINQLTPYCRRLDNGEKYEEIFDILDDNIANKITFNELRKQGVTSEQLLSWSAPIDLVEQYEMNNESSGLFYNCSSPWFGSKCQYRFFYDLYLSFNEIVKASVDSRSNISPIMSITTCYRFLDDCDRGPWSLCLDWREICDGKADCMSGEDEKWCETLEMTKCADDQYRCHYGGQCIPLIFAQDSYLSMDCLDGSDEREFWLKLFSSEHNPCVAAGAFRCEERISRYRLSFPCGDGQFLSVGNLPIQSLLCKNMRNRQVTLAMLTSFDHIKDVKCREAFRCSLLSNRIYGE